MRYNIYYSFYYGFIIIMIWFSQRKAAIDVINKFMSAHPEQEDVRCFREGQETEGFKELIL